MNKKAEICLIGDVIVDVTLPKPHLETKLRLGGIVHAARALWALNIPYDVCYFAPSYLDMQIHNYLKHHGCESIIKLGNIEGSPSVILINEEKETGHQGYELLLRDEVQVHYNKDGLDALQKTVYKNHLLIAGQYDLIRIANMIKSDVHVDLANNFENIHDLKQLSCKLKTIFISTSSGIAKNLFKKDFKQFVDQFSSFTDEIIIKENRGGSRAYNFATNKLFYGSSQPRKISHSVGVGDVYDVTYITSPYSQHEQSKKLALSSWIAAEYATTSFPDDFKRAVGRVLKSSIDELVALKGISLPWEIRKEISIYIASPDFSFYDTTAIDVVESALLYHNFRPRRPIKENGQMESNATKIRRQELVSKDLEILYESSLVVAVLLNNDPGTLVEIGYAVAKGIPTILYDPYNLATNCMLTELPDLVSNDLDEIITEVFVKTGSNDK